MPDQVIEVMIRDWEIECCAPPPVIGAVATWQLGFTSSVDGLAREDVWTVTHHDSQTVLLDRDGIHAAWTTIGEAPPPGIRTLRGCLTGTVHGTLPGPVPDGLPPVSGRVQRIRIASHEFEWVGAGERRLRPVAATRTLRDVRESPRWFNQGAIGPGRRQSTGVLIDLAVRRPGSNAR